MLRHICFAELGVRGVARAVWLDFSSEFLKCEVSGVWREEFAWYGEGLAEDSLARAGRIVVFGHCSEDQEYPGQLLGPLFRGAGGHEGGLKDSM